MTVMNKLQEQLSSLPSYEVQRLDPAHVMNEFRLASTKLLSNTISENLEGFNHAQRAAGYLIDEIGFDQPEEAPEIQAETLRISGEVVKHLGGFKILEQKPPETDRVAFYRWAICSRHSALSEKIAA